MSTLPASAAGSALADTTTQSHATQPAASTTETSVLQTLEAMPSSSAQLDDSSSAKPIPPTDLNRSETEAIGPSTDTPATAPDNTNGPVLVIMLLLITGARHPYKIDEKYLKKRNVTVEGMDPINISVYTLKELIWRDWREGTSIFSFPFYSHFVLLFRDSGVGAIGRALFFQQPDHIAFPTSLA